MDEYYELYRKYSNFTMISPDTYVRNLIIADLSQKVEGAIVECGTWRGGMIAGIADLLGDEREYYLFDSFEGLPPAKEIDGEAAIAWQKDTASPIYYNNCSTDESFAREAIQLSRATNYHVVKGWFNQTLSSVKFDKIAILRLDGDWYDSTVTCLESLYQHVEVGGVIIIDDYYTWDGCSRAVHDFFAKYKLADRIRQFDSDVCYILKR